MIQRKIDKASNSNYVILFYKLLSTNCSHNHKNSLSIIGGHLLTD